MSVKHREDSIVMIRRREALRPKVADNAWFEDGSIHLDMPAGSNVIDGTIVEFCSPCTSEEVSGGVVIDGIVYTVVGPDNRCVTGIGCTWESGAWISVAISLSDGPKAYLQTSKLTCFDRSVDVTGTWATDTVGGYYQAVTVPGLLETDKPVLDVKLGADLDANALVLDAWACVTRAVATAETLTLYANDTKPVANFTVNVKVVR